MTEFEIISRLLLASLLGALIGAEREFHGHPAGLRTHFLVCVGAALIVITNIKLAQQFNSPNIDVTRMAAQVVSGIGFLGAGTIIRSRDRIRGLTTAATLWAAAALGLAAGCGYFVTSFSAVIIVLVGLTMFKPLTEKLTRRRSTQNKMDDDAEVG